MGFFRAALNWHGLTGRGRFALSVIPVAVLLAAQTQVPTLSNAGAVIALLLALAFLLFWGYARRRLRAPDWTEPYRATAIGTRPRRITPVVEGDTCVKQAATETLPGGPSYTVLEVGPMATDFTAAVTIPDGFVFVLGDNRDNSLDSRIAQAAGGVGLVALAAVAGRVRLVLYSQEGREGRVLRIVE
ncbi:S26 family signal peptidase [Antarctobacter sp.]|uniref:S26 family signal peptidase n=1 Tax=Antarctobacter sp. TaxID=1872577 RepID=UPI002B269B07|nr:S26 family signal peptidase [Antarctobacter sp.]